MPVDRKAPGGVTAQTIEWLKKSDKAWLGITPEGTRSKVKGFKKGYLRIAYGANVPVFLIGVHGPTREVVLDKAWPLTGDEDADNAAIENYYRNRFIGVKPENQ